MRQATTLCEKMRHYDRRNLPHEKRARHFQTAGMAGDEVALRESRRGGKQGIPAQLSATIRGDILQGEQGHCAAGGRFGAFEH